MDINEEQIAFYSELGRAITQWAHVEHALMWIALACFNKDDYATLPTGFFAIENFRTKVQFADSVVAARFGKTKHMADWTALVDRMGNQSKARNRLAHYWMLGDPDNRAGRRYMLLPRREPLGTKLSTRHQKYPSAICLRDIARHRLEFFALTVSLENFYFRLSGRKEPFPKSLEQPKNPPTIARIRREIDAYASRPPRPSRA
ncbi:MAG: hypothetical protein IIA00_10140 [Proteobacteria bacterium]|nr:hypothetical protein [Pseudomonadota bacterium]